MSIDCVRGASKSRWGAAGAATFQEAGPAKPQLARHGQPLGRASVASKIRQHGWCVWPELAVLLLQHLLPASLPRPLLSLPGQQRAWLPLPPLSELVPTPFWPHAPQLLELLLVLRLQPLPPPPRLFWPPPLAAQVSGVLVGHMLLLVAAIAQLCSRQLLDDSIALPFSWISSRLGQLAERHLLAVELARRTSMTFCVVLVVAQPCLQHDCLEWRTLLESLSPTRQVAAVRACSASATLLRTSSRTAQ
mmetsp:Transcript_54383/g.140494  ORF Transcript_54383/g.140494 Transcript_54383/m.140494 type:complete len:248 (-) Transcript_54383:72-815(-)